MELDKVLLIADGDKVITGTPNIEQAKVIATAKGEGRAKKIIVMKYKAKVRYTKKTGHRQFYTKLSIDEIVSPGTAEEKSAKKTTSRRKKEVSESGT